MATFDDPTGPTRKQAPGASPAVDPAAKWIEYEEFIEAQLRKTRGHVRAVDIADGLMTLAAATLAYFFAAAMIDHWVIAGGLGSGGRWILLAIYLAGAGYYLAVHVLPLFIRQINPVYAADTIERSRPSLKNALVNFLFFRDDPDGLSPAMYQAVEEQAATNLAKAHVDAAVDRSRLIRIGYALLGILLVCALYTLFSPKDLFRTVGRVIMPWAEISAPTQTAILDIEPGDWQAFRGQQVEVSARAQGLPADSKVMLVYSTRDGQTVGKAIEMLPDRAGYRHSAQLPAGSETLEQSLEYHIVAGDARTRAYKLDVVAAPTLVVQAIEYNYPTYTGLLAQRVEHQGDIRAIEGTQVTIHALANQDIASANVDFDGDRKLDVRMQVERQQAQGSFRLALTEDRQKPWHTSYELLFKNDRGQQNPQPVRHRIDVIPDLAPELQIVQPKADTIEVPLSGFVDIEIAGVDPDFALRKVMVQGNVGRQKVVDRTLLDEAWRGQWVRKFRFEPQPLKLKVGDVCELVVVAEDNKDPRPNRVETSKKFLRVVSPTPQNQDRVAQNRPNNNRDQRGGEGEQKRGDGQAGQPGREGDQGKPQAGNEGEAQNDKTKGEPDAAPHEGQPRQGEQAEQGKPQGQSGQQNDRNAAGQQGQSADNSGDRSGGQERDSQVPSDGSDDADAIQRILKHREEQQPQDGGKQATGKANDKPSDGNQNDSQKQQGGDKQSGSQQNNQPGNNANRPGGEQQPNDRQQPSPDQNGNEKGQQPQGGRDGASHDPQPNASPDKQGNDKPSATRDPQQPQNGQQAPNAADKGAGQGRGGEKSSDTASKDRQDAASPDRGGGQKDTAEKQPRGADNKDGQRGKNDKFGDNNKSGDSDKSGKDEKSRGDGQSQEKGREQTPGGSDPTSKDQNGQGQSQPTTSRDSQSKDSGGKASDNANSKSGESGGQRGEGQRGQGQPQDKPSQDDRSKGQPDNSQPNRNAGDARDAAEQSDKSGDPSNAKPADGQRQPGGGEQSRDAQSNKDRNSDQQAGAGQREQGGSGEGQQGRDNRGSPSPQDTNRPSKPENQDSSDGKEGKPSEAQSPSTSKQQSNTKGADDGDRSGGGKQGGGQKATKSGTGEAGQNAPADQGAGRSDEAGAGEEANRAGDKGEAKQPTGGNSGSKAGNGTNSRSANNNDNSNDQGQPGRGGQQPTNPNRNAQQQAPKGQDSPPGSSTSGESQGGDRAGNQKSAEPWKPIPDSADAANLDYARAATDLALEHLRNELRKDQPDQSLLDRLGWSKQDLEKFVKRWEAMRNAAQAPGEKGQAAQRELDESLKSLGLRPKSTALQSNTARDDQVRGTKESRRTSPPAEYSEQFRSYMQGAGRGGK